jgi:excisionase family DNA binding protein
VVLLSIKSASARLDVPEPTLRKWLAERRFPVVKLGRLTGLRTSDLDGLALSGLPAKEPILGRRSPGVQRQRERRPNGLDTAEWLAVRSLMARRRPNEPVDDQAKVTFRLPERLVKRAKHYAIDADQDLQDVIREALEQFLARKGARP